MSDYVRDVMRLIRSARESSDSDVAILEEATRLADINGDISLGIEARIKLISAANYSGRHELVLIAFAWCLAQLDRDAQIRAKLERRVLWYYKWVVPSLSDYAQVSRQQIEKSLADMTDRFMRGGHGMGPIYKVQTHTTIRLGDPDAHRIARELWKKSPRENISDCLACDVDATVECDLDVDDLTSAVANAEPVISGRLRCTEVPCLTFARLLLPLLKLGSCDMAEDLHRKTYRQALSTRDFLPAAGRHCAYLTLAHQFTKAIRTFEVGMSWMTFQKRTWDRMIFLQHAIVLFECLADGDDQPMKINVPADAPFYRNDDNYVPSVVALALQQMLAQHVGEFNRRNGNTHLDDRHASLREMVRAIKTAS